MLKSNERINAWGRRALGWGAARSEKGREARAG